VELRDREGRIVAATGPMRYHGPGTFAMNWSGGTAAVLAPAPAGGPFWGIAVMLLITAISALLMTRWLARPLAVLSATARALGAGQLFARANLRRNDELGDVAAAFDEMAERIENLVHGQRELLANVSHELRTPIARIHVALDLAAEGSAQDVADSLPGIAGDLSELERLTSDILTRARLELSSSVPPLRVEPTAARQLIEGIGSPRFSPHRARPGRTPLPSA
jgi:two-component system, OmpR family, sensor kinase